MNKIFKILLLIILGLFSTIVLGNSSEKKIKIGLLVPMTGNDKYLGQLLIKSSIM